MKHESEMKPLSSVFPLNRHTTGLKMKTLGILIGTENVTNVNCSLM